MSLYFTPSWINKLFDIELIKQLIPLAIITIFQTNSPYNLIVMNCNKRFHLWNISSRVFFMKRFFSAKTFPSSIKKSKNKMPPKKNQVAEKPLLGRPGNNLKMGIVGLPNVGKSSFFNSITNSSMPSENFPFCTISPAEARVAVPDERFDWLVDFYKPKSVIPANLTVIDIAGLVKGAAEGQGLGNAFLSHIRAVDGIFHLCRAFDDADIIHVEGDIDPVRDFEIIHEELRLKDEDFINKLVDASRKDVVRAGKGGNAQDKGIIHLNRTERTI
jgi:hypothetical protein